MSRDHKKFFFLILLFIAFDVLCDNYIAGSFSTDSPIREFCLLSVLLILQILISPIQTGLSDLYGRKISLVFSMSFSLLSLIIAFFYELKIIAFIPMLILLNLSKGVFGNTAPIAWAAVGDINGKSQRLLFALTTSAYAVGYLVLIFFNKFISDQDAIKFLVVSFAICVYVCLKFFRDLKDPNINEIRNLDRSFFRYVLNEVALIKKDIMNKSLRMIFFSWILWEISLYVILVLYADFANYESSAIEIAMMVGYIIGCVIMKFLSGLEDIKLIRIGYLVSIFSLIPYFLLVSFFQDIHLLMMICYFFHAIGNALLTPTLFNIISKHKKIHERGKIYGLAESTDTIAFLIAVIAIEVYKQLNINIFFLVSFSFLTVLVSWFPYKKYEKLVSHSMLNK